MTTESVISPISNAAPKRDPAPAPYLVSSRPQASDATISTFDAAKSDDTSAFSYTLQFDPDTQRLMLESRDPVTGAVLYQVPSKYVIEQLRNHAQQSSSNPLGLRFDRSA